MRRLTFNIVFVGLVSVFKGVPVLIEAMRSIEAGTFGSRSSATPVAAACGDSCATRSRDPHITMVAGDPLPHLLAADVCVHPTFEDGFAYSAMEALACGVPVIVTHDTGMKDHVREGENGFIVPTGNVDALVERLRAMIAQGGQR